MKIQLIQPDTPSLSEPLSFPSLGILYISSFLKNLGVDVEVEDLTGGRIPKSSYDADVVGFSCQTVHYKRILEMYRKLKDTMQESKFIIGGPHPTWFTNECSADGFDFVVSGEGEVSVSEYLSLITKSDIVNESNLRLDINELLPDWEAIDIKRYKYLLDGRKCMNIMTSRGNCPFGKSGHCTFCPKTSMSTKLRFRSVESVLIEARILRDKYGCGSLAIYDDNVLINKTRDKKIFRGLKELDMRFRCMTRANLASREDLKMLKDYGCTEICLGAESGDPFILQNIINKGTTVQQNTDFVKNCLDVNLNVKAYLMIGLPSETEKSVENTRKWLRDAKPNNYDISIFIPYKGSEIYNHKEKFEIHWDEDKLQNLWFDGTTQFGESPVSTKELTAFRIEELRDSFLEEFQRGDGGTTSYWGPGKEA